MLHLAYIVLFFAFFQLGNALLNLFFVQKLRRAKYAGNDLVSILIPARNEEKNITALLNSLQKLSYKNLEIIVFDDHSDDRTAEIVSKFAGNDNRIRLIESKHLEKGWLGKNYACHQLANMARGRYLLFIDCDVMLNGSIIEDAVFKLNSQDLGLLTIFPKQIMRTTGERITVPIMNYILLTLLPLIFVRTSPFASHAAANGQFMLFSADVYHEYKPHSKFKSSPVEDILTARYLKRNKVKVACLPGDNRIVCRMYKSYTEALKGFSKNVLVFFGNQPVLAILFWFITTLGFIPVLLINICWFVLYVVLVLITRTLVSIISKQHVGYNILLLIPQQFFLLHVIIKSVQFKYTKKYMWKGRKIYQS